MKEESNLPRLLRLVAVPPQARTADDIAALQELTQDFEFFKEKVKENSEAVQRYFCEHMQLEEHPADTYVFHIGDHADKFYVMLDGTLSVLVPIEGTMTSVAQFQQGKGFGELSLINNSTRLASVLCLEPCKFAVLEKAKYLHILG